VPIISARIHANRESGLFLESITIASACNKVFRKRFLQPDTIGLNPTGRYACNKNYSKKAVMWLLHMEETDRVKIMHGRNGREYKVPELLQFSVDGYSPETRTIYEFFGCYFHDHTCQPFRDVITTSVDTLAERYERTMSRLDQLKRSGYLVKVQWECEFDESGIVKQKPQLLTHPIVQQTPLRTRDALCGGRNEAMCLYRKARENETIQYVDVMSLYPYICKFPISNPVIHVGDACRDIEPCSCMEGLIRCSSYTTLSFPTDVIVNSCSAYVEHAITPPARNVRIPRMRFSPSRVPR